MNGKQLKNSILQWAIQGKLVPQDPNDEPASVLLEQIRAEKARLVKEKKIKKDKNESIIFRGDDNSHYEKFSDGTVKCIDDEIPFEIPESWEWCRLGSIIDFSKSSSVKSSEIEDDAWILDLEDIEKDTGVLLAKKRMRDVQSKSDKHLFHSGEILYSKLRPYLNKVIIADEKGYCTTEILCFDFQLIYNKYAQLYLMSPCFIEYAMSDAYGVKMPRLGSKQGNNALMPIPPIKEQHRIVEKIEDLMPLVNQYSESQDKLNKLNEAINGQLKKSILQEAIQGKLVPQLAEEGDASELLKQIELEKQKLVKEGKLKKKDLVSSTIFRGDDNRYYENVNGKTECIDDEIPFDIPESWRWVRLSNISIVARGGSPRPIKEYLTECSDGVNWIKIGDTEKGGKYINTCAEKIKPEGVAKSRLVKPGDFLLTNSMSFGRPYITNVEGCIHDGWLVISQYVLVYETDFLFYILSSPFAYRQFSDKTAGAVVQNLNKDKVAESIFPLPPIQEQKRIVAKLTGIMNRM